MILDHAGGRLLDLPKKEKKGKRREKGRKWRGKRRKKKKKKERKGQNFIYSYYPFLLPSREPLELCFR
jgi:hypothetical protein